MGGNVNFIKQNSHLEVCACVTKVCKNTWHKLIQRQDLRKAW